MCLWFTELFFLVNLILGALSSEFHSTSSTSESSQKKERGKSEQKTKIEETAKLKGEKEMKNLLLSYCGKLL